MIRWMLFVYILPFQVFSQTGNEKTLPLTVKHTTDFKVTGDGGAAAWENAGWINLTPRKGVLKYLTKAKLLYSDSGIYVLYSCEDKKITATLREDFADLFKEDVVEIFFWPDENTPLYFEYELSPLNYELPILVPNHKGDFFGWKPWHYEGKRLTRHATSLQKDKSGSVTGWTAEFFIPFALLKPLQNVPPQKGAQWRVNLYRIDYDDGYSNWTWQPIQKNFHDFERFGTIKFN